MLPRKILDFKSSEMARNASETVYSDVNFQSLTNKEASTVLCSVVKHAGSG